MNYSMYKYKIPELYHSWLEDVKEGIQIRGYRLKNERFADDHGMVASTEKGLQRTKNRINETAKKYDMKIKEKKTKMIKNVKE